MNFWKGLFLRPPDLSHLSLGEAGEEWASFLYRKRGYEILSRNYAVYAGKKLGEIDIICRDKRQLVIVEVKTRSDENFMPLEEIVDWRKQKYLRRMAKLFLRQNPEYTDYDVQIDIVGILIDPVDKSVKTVKIIENAIEDV